MNIAIIYNSQTGFTKKYAEWLKEEFGEDSKLFTLKDAKKIGAKSFSNYDTVVYGGWVCAGSINGVNWIKSNIPLWHKSVKKIAIWATGGSLKDNPDIQEMFKKILTEEEKKYVKLFYCQGGFNYDKMSGSNKMFMKIFSNMLKSRKDEKSQTMAKMISQSYDITDKKFLQPIIDYINS